MSVPIAVKYMCRQMSNFKGAVLLHYLHSCGAHPDSSVDRASNYQSKGLWVCSAPGFGSYAGMPSASVFGGVVASYLQRKCFVLVMIPTTQLP